MKRDIRKIKIENDFFGTTTLDLFGEISRSLLIYGANGTGKSTIGRAVLQIKNGSGDLKSSVFQDEEGIEVFIEEKEKSHIHVFNEDFIENQVSFKSDTGKINSIVMFGKNIENDKAIENLKKDIEEIKGKILNLKIESYEDFNNPLSPWGYYNQIKKIMSSDWAESERKIRNITTKPQVKQEDIDRVIENEKYITFNESIYDEKKKILEKITGDSQQIINESITNLEVKIESKKQLILLEESFERPVGTMIAKKISETILQKGLSRLEEIKENLESKDYCPYCFRNIDSDYVNHVIGEINEIQNNLVKNHIDDLNKSLQQKIFIDLNEFMDIDKELCLEIQHDLRLLNENLTTLNDKITEKINNPYEPIRFFISFDDILIKINNAIRELESKRILYNENIRNKSKLKEEMKTLNYARIAYNLSSTIKNYKIQLAEQKYKKEQEIMYENAIKEKSEEILRLHSESKNIGLALVEINNLLGLIFLSKERLKIEEQDDKYHIKVRNKSISLKKLSSGERNAIALCYFFVLMNENCYEHDVFKNSSLIVLDDPLTRFDHNNKIGIYSFLRKMISSIVKNSDSKLIILTHQIESFFDIEKILDDVMEEKKKKIAVLRNKKLENFKGNKNIYISLLKEVYLAVLNADQLSEDDLENLGNKIRKILEAFSTFIYGCGINKLSTDTSIISEIKDNEIRKYLENSLYKISLNSSSHFEERTYSLVDLLNISYFEKDGLIRSLKDSMLLIYLLNKNHIMKMLDITDTKFFDDYIENIKSAI